MVTSPQQRTDRSPIEEIANRAAGAGAGLAAAAKAVGLADHKRMLEQASRRVREYHVAQMRAMGMGQAEIDEMATEADEMGGDVITTGDITFQGQQSSQPQQPTQLPPGNTGWQQILPWALAAALGTGAAAQWLAGDKPATPGPDNDTRYKIQIGAE